MPAQDEEHVGIRIAALRKRGGLTQDGLAQLIPYSYSLLRHVESGHRAASPQLVEAVASALRVDVTALTGPPVNPQQPARIAALVRPVREALDLYDLPPAPDLRPRSAAELTSSAETMCRLVRATEIFRAATELPALLAELTAACQERPSGELWRALASG